jgi:hypothetical protein
VRGKGLDLINNRGKGYAKKKGAKRVPLLNATGGKDRIRVVVQKDRGVTITPLDPVVQLRIKSVNNRKERGAVNAIECVAKINLKGSEPFTCVMGDEITQGMSDDLHPSRTTHPKIFPSKQ